MPPFDRSGFSIGHRAAPLLFPERTKESYEAALGRRPFRVRRDLHATTNIVETDPAQKRTVPPAVDPATGALLNGFDVGCSASELALEEFRSPRGKMDAANRNATTIEGYLGGTANFRTDLHSTCGTLLSHAESIELFKALGAKYTPELKGNDGGANFQVDDVFGSQADYAQAMIDQYKVAGVDPTDVYAQSFNVDDVRYWIENEPAFGEQAVFLDGGPIPRPNPGPFLQDVAAMGVPIVAPPMPMLVILDASLEIVPSDHAIAARDGYAMRALSRQFRTTITGARAEGAPSEWRKTAPEGGASMWPATIAYPNGGGGDQGRTTGPGSSLPITGSGAASPRPSPSWARSRGIAP